MARLLLTLLTGLILLVASTVGCSPPSRADRESPLESNAVAVVQGAAITQDTLRLALEQRADRGSLEAKTNALEQLIRTEALAARARAEGFDRRPEIRAAVTRLIAAKYQEERMAAETAALQPSANEILEYYGSRQAVYTTPAMRKGAIILIEIPAKATAERRGEAERRAQHILESAERATSNAEFARLALEHSEHQATRYRGGELGWLAAGEAAPGIEPEVMDTLFSLTAPGQLARLVKSPGGFYIVKLVDTKPATVLPLNQVREAIRHKLIQERRHHHERDFFETVKRGLEIRMNVAAIEAVRLPSPSQTEASPRGFGLPSTIQ